MNAYTAKRLGVALYEIKRAVRVHGEEYTFSTPSMNEFGEPTEEVSTLVLSGLWHTSNSFVQKTISEATRIHSKQQPQLICSYEDVKGLSKEAKLTHNERVYTISDIVDVGNFGTIADICLEEVQSE